MHPSTDDDAHCKNRALPAVHILATGGTIAGRSRHGDSTTQYQAGVVAVSELVASAPRLAGLARISGEQIANIGSEHMTEEVWLKLAAAVARARADSDVAGVVVLHGTDTMEETAFFLDLAAGGDKPVVLTGAMRPADAVSADGPMNIHNAVGLAATPGAAGRGVLVCMNDRIFAARDAVKADTLNVDAFAAPATGPIGRMVDGKAVFYCGAGGVVPSKPAFSTESLLKLPRVEIVYGHAGQGRLMIDAAVATGAEGIVHAGVGMGHVHRAARAGLVDAARKGVAVVLSTRVAAGPVPEGDELLADGFIAAGSLNPQKARVLLQLALTRTRDTAEIRTLFAAG